MSGIIVPLMEQRHIDFSYLVANSSEVLTLHTAVPVAPYKSGLFMLRIHDVDLSLSAKFTFRAYPTLPCNTDGRQFTNTGLAVFSIEVNASSSEMYEHDDNTAIGASSLLIQIHVAQDTAQSVTVAGQFSAALLLRES